MTKAMPKDEAGEVATALDRFNQKWGPMLGGNASNSTITVTGATGWQVTACLLLAVLGMTFGAFGLYIAKDTRDAQRADALELRQDIKAIRAYINAGMVRPKEK